MIGLLETLWLCLSSKQELMISGRGMSTGDVEWQMMCWVLLMVLVLCWWLEGWLDYGSECSNNGSSTRPWDNAMKTRKEVRNEN